MQRVLKLQQGRPNLLDFMANGDLQLIINIPSGKGARTDEGRIRAAAVSHGIPCITTIQAADAAVLAMEGGIDGAGPARPLSAVCQGDEYDGRRRPAVVDDGKIRASFIWVEQARSFRLVPFLKPWRFPVASRKRFSSIRPVAQHKRHRPRLTSIQKHALRWDWPVRAILYLFPDPAFTPGLGKSGEMKPLLPMNVDDQIVPVLAILAVVIGPPAIVLAVDAYAVEQIAIAFLPVVQI